MKYAKLVECCDLLSGGTPSKSNAEFWKGNIPWFSPKDIKSFELIASQDHVSEAAVNASSTKLVYEGTILVVGRSGVLAHTLPVGIIRQPSTFNQDIRAIVPHDGYDPEYIALFIKSQQQTVLRAGVKLGPTVHSLKSMYLENLLVPIVGTEEQRCITAQVKAQLAEVETIRKVVEKQLSEINLLPQKILAQAFEGRDDGV